MWRDGTYLGISRGSGEAIIATKDGNVVKVRTLRRRPTSDKWSHDMIKNIKGTPLRPNTTSEDIEIPAPEDEISIRVRESGVGMPVPEGLVEESTIRRMKLTRQMFNDHGYTSGCPGCRAIRLNLDNPQPHTDACRDRIET
eukprot:9020537-Karenia_brevis.AAC.1